MILAYFIGWMYIVMFGCLLIITAVAGARHVSEWLERRRRRSMK